MFLAFQSCLASPFLCRTPGARRGHTHCNGVFYQLLSLCPPATSSLYPKKAPLLTTCLFETAVLGPPHQLQSSLSYFSSPCVPPNTLHKVLSNQGFLSDVYLKPFANAYSFSQTLEPKDLGFPHRPWEVEKERKKEVTGNCSHCSPVNSSHESRCGE